MRGMKELLRGYVLPTLVFILIMAALAIAYAALDELVLGV